MTQGIHDVRELYGIGYYERDGTTFFNLEDTARALGLTRIAASGNEVVLWSRVEGYLQEIGSSAEVWKTDFVHLPVQNNYIPESVFYRLVMKVKNKTAKKLQGLIADGKFLVSQRTTQNTEENNGEIQMEKTINKDIVANGEFKMGDTGIQVINDVSCYEKDGVVYLKLEDVARGLGFIRTQTVSGAEYTNLRWNTVKQYLREIGFGQEVVKSDFIPENVFYRLAMKAKNTAAKNFQAWVANELIPSVRKNGVYMTPEVIEKILYNPDFIMRLASDLKAKNEECLVLEAQNEELSIKNDLLVKENSTWDDRTIITTLIPSIAGKMLLDIPRTYGMFYRELKKYYHIDLPHRYALYKRTKSGKGIIDMAKPEEVDYMVRVAATMAARCRIDFKPLLMTDENVQRVQRAIKETKRAFAEAVEA